MLNQQPYNILSRKKKVAFGSKYPTLDKEESCGVVGLNK